MKIYLTDQTAQFPKHLEQLCKTGIMKYDISTLKEKITEAAINTTKSIEQIDAKFLFNYSIFPGNIMGHLTQWDHERRNMRPGDTIVQQVFIPPTKTISQKIIFGVRIKEIIKKQNRIGYSYETLEGHVEKGISTFTLEETHNGQIIFRIHTFAAPATLLSKLLGPVFSGPYQDYCTRRALMNVKRQLEITP